MRRAYLLPILAFVLLGLLLIESQGTAGPERRRPPMAEPTVTLSGPVRPKMSKKDSLAAIAARLESYIGLTAKTLDKRVQGALAKIDGTPRRLLALRTYIERRNINGVWAWTNREMAAYRKSMDFRIANAEVDKVVSLFQRTHPGYQLRVTKLARSLEDQIGLWNRTKSVESASSNFMKQIVRSIVTYPDTATKQSLAKFQALLRKQSVSPVPTVAVPGLSHHGQLRAYDFIIWQGDKIVAGTDARSIRGQWIGGGWSNRLRQAIFGASNRFDGPLKSPNEPWHYTYIR